MAVSGALQIPIEYTDNIKEYLGNVQKETEATFKDLANKLSALNQKNIFKLNTKDLDKEVENIGKKIQELTKTKQEIKLQPQTKDTEKAIEIINNRIKELNKSSKLFIEIKEAKTSKLSDIDKKIKELTKERDLKISSAKSAKQVKKETQAIDKELQHLTKVREIKVEIDDKNIEKAKKSLTQLSLVAKASAVAIGGIGAALGFAVKQAIDFQSQFGEVETLLSGVPTEAIDGLKQGIIDLSKQTGILTSEGIPALYQAISAGVSPDNAISFLETASKTAIGGVTDLQTAVDGLTSIMNAYGQDVYDVNEVSDLLFTTMKLGKTTIGELSASYFNVIPTASSLGVSLQDISAAMSTITAQGTPTSVATTQLRQALVELGSEGSKASKKFKELSGQSFRDFIKNGGDLQTALKMLEAEAKRNNTTINNLFSSVEAGNAVLGLTGAGAEKFASDLEAMAKATGATNEAFQKIDETPAQRIKKLMANFQALTLELGQNLLPTAEKLFSAFEKGLPTIQKLGEFVGSVVSVLVEKGNIIVPVIAGLATAFVGLNVALAVTNPTLIGTSGAIGLVTTAFGALNVATGGILIVIGALTAGLVTLIMNLDKLKPPIVDLAKKSEELAQSLNKSYEAMKAQTTQGARLVEQYRELASKSQKTAEEQEKLKSILEQLKTIYPELAEKIELNKGALDGLTTSYEDYITVAGKAAILDAERVINHEREVRAKLELTRTALEANLALYRPDEADKKAMAEKRLAEISNEITASLDRQADAERKRDEIERNALKLSQGRLETEKEIQTVKSQGTKTTEETTKVEKKKTVEEKKAKEEKKDPLKELEAEYKARQEIIQNTINDEAEKNQALLDNDVDYYSRRLSLQKENAESILKLGEEEKEARAGELEALYKDIEETQAKLDELNKPVGTSFFDDLKDNWQSVVNYIGGFVNSVGNLTSQLLQNQIDEVQATADKELDILDSKYNSEIEAIDKKLEEENKLYEKQLKELDKREEERAEIIGKYEEQIAELNEEIGEHATEEKYLQYQEQLTALEEKLAGEELARQNDELLQQQLEQQQQLREEQALLLKEQKEKEYEERRLQLERQLAIEQAKLERKQAEQNKVISLFNAGISIAQGVAMALGSAPPPINFINVGLVSAMGAAQIALIASTPLPSIPTYSKGGIVGEANNQYYEKLVGKSGNSEDKTLIWASKGERVLTQEQNKAYERMIANNNVNNSRNVNNNQNVNMNFTFNTAKELNEKRIMDTLRKEMPKLVVESVSRGY